MTSAHHLNFTAGMFGGILSDEAQRFNRPTSQWQSLGTTRAVDAEGCRQPSGRPWSNAARILALLEWTLLVRPF
jgi:hypothetical protein